MTREFLKDIKFGIGYLQDRKDAVYFIKNGYNPTRLLMHYKVTNEILQYILAEQIVENKN